MGSRCHQTSTSNKALKVSSIQHFPWHAPRQHSSGDSFTLSWFLSTHWLIKLGSFPFYKVKLKSFWKDEPRIPLAVVMPTFTLNSWAWRLLQFGKGGGASSYDPTCGWAEILDTKATPKGRMLLAEPYTNSRIFPGSCWMIWGSTEMYWKWNMFFDFFVSNMSLVWCDVVGCERKFQRCQHVIHWCVKTSTWLPSIPI